MFTADSTTKGSQIDPVDSLMRKIVTNGHFQGTQVFRIFLNNSTTRLLAMKT